MRSQCPVGAVLTLLIIAVVVAVPPSSCESSYTPLELTFVVYADGYVTVDYFCDVDPTKVEVNVSLFGSLYEDVLVEDQDGLPLDYSSIDGGVVVDTIGAASVLISYVTTDLTGKAGQIWAFTVDTPTPTSVILPPGATIWSLNTVPQAMGTIDDSLLLLMPAGELDVSYTIGLVGTREHALALIRDAEEEIEAIQEEGVLTPEADELLLQAYSELDAGRYPEAESLAEQAKTAAEGTRAVASSAEAAIATAGATIAAAEAVGATVGLENAKSLLQYAEEEFAVGDYEDAQVTAEQARSIAADAEKPSETGIPVTWLYAGAGIVAVALVATYFLRGRRRRPEVEVRHSFDLNALFEAHPTLRMDDREVIRFLAEKGGEAFAAEVRERFDMPRTSLWRMIRRLEGEGVVEVQTIGGQSLVRILGIYRSGGAGG
ncbi:MAG: hypothetical protein JSV27_04335 [Candidatus Bathyarchaeota archaeon]|nr:MAG: hypothetical protein JSV27_04335 [Candidatus Bathyarchaeota archaeon]